MACVQVLRIGSAGVSLEFLIEDCNGDGTTTIVDITDATTLDVFIRKEDKTELTKTGVVFTGGANGNGTDGIVQYVTEPGLAVAGDEGKWKARAIVTFPDGGVFPSSWVSIPVKE